MNYAWLILLLQTATVEVTSSEDARNRSHDEPSVRAEDDVRKYSTRTPDKRQVEQESIVVPEVPVFIEIDEYRRRPNREDEPPRLKLPKSSD